MTTAAPVEERGLAGAALSPGRVASAQLGDVLQWREQFP